jgi:hypothetical protein
LKAMSEAPETIRRNIGGQGASGHPVADEFRFWAGWGENRLSDPFFP